MLVSATSAQTDERLEFERGLMGTTFRIVVFTHDSTRAWQAADRAFGRIDSLNSLLSDYLPESELNRLSRSGGSGEGIRVSADLWNVLAFAQSVSDETSGAFDVTVGPLTLLWRRAMRRGALPDPDALEMARASVGYEFVEVDSTGGDGDRSVRVLKSGMRLDLGGIAKGYAVDEAFKTLRDGGLSKVLVDGGGDMRIGSPPTVGDGWRVLVSVVDEDGVRAVETMALSNTAVATSGAKYRHIDVNGERYSHIVDPTTGMGLTVDREVVVFARNCTTADALASALSVMGPEDALAVLQHHPGSAARFVEARGGAYQMTDIPSSSGNADNHSLR